MTDTRALHAEKQRDELREKLLTSRKVNTDLLDELREARDERNLAYTALSSNGSRHLEIVRENESLKAQLTKERDALRQSYRELYQRYLQALTDAQRAVQERDEARAAFGDVVSVKAYTDLQQRFHERLSDLENAKQKLCAVREACRE